MATLLYRLGRLSFRRRGPVVAVWLLLLALLGLDDATFADVSAIAACSVVPSLTDALTTIAERRERPLLVASAGTVPIAIRTDRPAEVGADRLVNAIAAARLHGTPVVVADFGTATTFDCVAGDGAFVGGDVTHDWLVPWLGLDRRGAVKRDAGEWIARRLW